MREKIEMVDLQPEQKERTLNCMTKLYQSLEFFYQLVNDNKLSEINSMTNYSILIKTEKTWKIFMKNIFQDSGSGNLRATGMITDILSCAIRYMCRLKQSRI